MSNKFKDTDTHAHTQTHTHYFSDDAIDIKNSDLNKIKIDEKSYKNILIYYIRYVTIKDSKYWKINNVNSLYLVKSEFNGYFSLINENKYLTLVPINESKRIIKKIWRILE